MVGRGLSCIRLACAAVFPLLAAASSPVAHAAVPAGQEPVIDLLHASWTAREGAPAGITGIAQTQDGWIWIGSTSGLYKFDGVRFLRATGDEAPLSSNVSAIGVLPDGLMWVGYQYGGVSLMAHGQTVAVTFNRPGTYNFNCSPHPSMIGQIVVTGEAVANARPVVVERGPAPPGAAQGAAHEHQGG